MAGRAAIAQQALAAGAAETDARVVWVLNRLSRVQSSEQRHDGDEPRGRVQNKNCGGVSRKLATMG